MSRIEDADRDARRAADESRVRKRDAERAANHRRQQENRFAIRIQGDSAGSDAATRAPAGSNPRESESLKAHASIEPPSREKPALRGEDSVGDAPVRDRGGKTSPSGDSGPERDCGSGGEEGEKRRAETRTDPAMGFRFNPALMAPVPVAKRREASSSERWRAVAAEIGQKIVERVHIGTNAAGLPEFQIDLRSDVLAGLSIRISGGQSQVHALFSGSDPAVLRLLRQNAERLKEALGKRGLTVGELRIEERT